jgi:ABC-type polysaccharide/polyol phosphate export permease
MWAIVHFMWSNWGGADQHAVRVLTPEPRKGFGLGRLRGRGELVANIVRRDLKLRYVQTRLGPVWVVLQPLIPALMFGFVFTRVVSVDTRGVPYLVFVTAAIAPWNFVSRALNRGGPVLIQERALITRVYFPRVAYQVAAVISSLVDLAVSLAIVAVAMAASGHGPTWNVLALPLATLWLAAVAMGASSLVSAMSVKRRDLTQMLPIATQAWLFVTPVAYPVASVQAYRWVVELNPMTGVVEAFRWSLTGQTTLSMAGFWSGASFSASLLVVGLLAFQRADWKLADVI